MKRIEVLRKIALDNVYSLDEFFYHFGGEMAENNVLKNATDLSDQKTVVITQQPEKEKVVVCDMCGHANPENTAICKMCSNYLKGVT